MVARAYTVAFDGIEPREVEVQCATAPGLPNFSIVYSIKLTFNHTLSHYRNVKPTCLLLYQNVFRVTAQRG